MQSQRASWVLWRWEISVLIFRIRMNVTAVNIGGMPGGFQGGFQTRARGGFGDPRGPRDGGHGVVIDGEFEEVDPDSLPSQPGSRPSGWTRH